MSFSDTVKAIDSYGLEHVAISAFKDSDAAYAKVKELEEQLNEAKSAMHQCSSKLDDIVRYAAKYSNKYTVDKSDNHKYILRIVESDMLYVITLDDTEEKIKWESFKCNKAKTKPE